MDEADIAAEDHYDRLWAERFENEYEEELKECEGEDCDNKIEQDEYLCEHCKKRIQRSWEEFKSQFNDEELDYLYDYVID